MKSKQNHVVLWVVVVLLSLGIFIACTPSPSPNEDGQPCQYYVRSPNTAPFYCHDYRIGENGILFINGYYHRGEWYQDEVILSNYVIREQQP